jgi:hypothetical protein
MDTLAVQGEYSAEAAELAVPEVLPADPAAAEEPLFGIKIKSD